MCLILHLETATKSCSVALSKDGELLALKESNDSEYSHGENLTLYISSVLSAANVSIKDLNAISVTSGPGSYTGLRIGASTAKGICFALEIPLISIDALLNLAFIAKANGILGNLCPMIDARRMEVYSTIFDTDLNSIKALSADVLDENSYHEFEPFTYFGDGAEKMATVWQDKNRTFAHGILSSANGHVQLAFKKFNSNDFENVAYFEPMYLKDFIGGKKKSE
jgi:tRNA threonylcarbamoyladenosine biosynthesis protein TsaB